MQPGGICSQGVYAAWGYMQPGDIKQFVESV